ncbi:unnamed protein product [Porites lobata]|uniref:mRNA-decapping enzyme C-terminal domain-containing protein n=1 Tax=Porites lobata TaxID=104759 RepID=A0ABN8PDU0_9CNID|nr:unnamed protein product [Porites lobata]
MAAERGSTSSVVKLNLSAIKKSDQYVVNIIDNASQVALYKFNGTTQAWEKTDVEGALFVYSRSTPPSSAFFIMNRLNMNNMTEPITNNMEFKLQDPFLLYRNLTKEIYGIWFYDSDECKRLAMLLTKLSSETAPTTKPVSNPPPPVQSPQKDKKESSTEEKVDIMQLFAKAQERYINETKASNPVTSSTASSNPQKQPVPQEQKEQQQRFLQQNQAQQEQLQRLFQNEDTRPKKQRAYSSPATYLSDKVPPSPMGSKTTSKGEEQENSVLPGGERQSRKGHNKVKSLTLSDVKMPVGPGGLITQTQDDSAIDSTKSGAQRKLFQSDRPEVKSMVTLPTPSTASAQSTVAAQVKESPQKPSQDQALAAAAAAAAAGSSLMSPLAFQSSGKVTIMTPPSQTKQPAPKMEIAPLTQEQLVQAMTYLLKNDPEFVTKIHEAYFKSLQDKLPT